MQSSRKFRCERPNWAQLANTQQRILDDHQRYDIEITRLTAVIAAYNATAPPGVDQMNSARCGDGIF